MFAVSYLVFLFGFWLLSGGMCSLYVPYLIFSCLKNTLSSNCMFFVVLGRVNMITKLAEIQLCYDQTFTCQIKEYRFTVITLTSRKVTSVCPVCDASLFY